MQNVPFRATGEAVPATIELALPRSAIVLIIATLSCGRTVMLGRAGRAVR